MKKPGGKALFWDYFGLRVDNEQFVILAEWRVLAYKWEYPSDLMAHLRVSHSSSIQSELQNAMKKEGNIVFDQYLGILQ